jgi:EAL domain-containing protein (putative c-di-GMP-specific phosphodiesterase class I)
LTGLVNRREFEIRLGTALDKLSRQPSEHSLMFLDLDQFKVVNDTCGHAIKIDGSFVTEMLNSKVDRAMVETIAHIARVMGKRTVAEFVESNEILQALREIGVDYAQGYAIGKPAPFETMYPLLADAHREVA